MNTLTNTQFETQMDFVRERNKIKYENKLMKEEDLYSQSAQPLFRQQREMEIKSKSEEEFRLIEQLIIQEQLENERKELNKFISDYVISKLNKNPQLNINELNIEAENLFYDRLLKKQQDEEYNRAVFEDMKKYREPR